MAGVPTSVLSLFCFRKRLWMFMARDISLRSSILSPTVITENSMTEAKTGRCIICPTLSMSARMMWPGSRREWLNLSPAIYRSSRQKIPTVMQSGFLPKTGRTRRPCWQKGLDISLLLHIISTAIATPFTGLCSILPVI